MNHRARKQIAPHPPAKPDYFADGFNARMLGKFLSACPHRDPAKRRLWRSGFRQALREGVGD